VLDRKFIVALAQTAWAADLFYVPAKEARLFFAVVIDLFIAKWLCFAKTTSGWKRTWFTDSQAGLRPMFDREGLSDDGIIGELLPGFPDKFAGTVLQLLSFKIHSKRRKR
jgi:hypothetical protein